MNIELKAMLTVLFKLFDLGKDLIVKAPVTSDISDAEAIMMGIPAIIANWNDISAEVKLLETPANLADLLAFITAQFVGIDSDAHAQGILTASLKLAEDLVIDGMGLANAIKG